MVFNKALWAAAMCVIAACENSQKPPQEGESVAGVDVRGSSDVNPTPAGSETQKPRVFATNFEAVAAKACAMAGGECLTSEHLKPGNVLVAGLNCRPLQPGMFCLRKGGVCEGHETQRCCERDTLTGEASVYGRVGCDRGYPVCLNMWNWRASSATSCTTRLANTVPDDAPSLWPGAVDVQTAARWACKQIGGHQVERAALGAAIARGTYDSLCAGYQVRFSDFGLCCVPKSACPEDPNVECCKRDGTVSPKFCRDGKAVCAPVALDFGMLREGPPGSCSPF